MIRIITTLLFAGLALHGFGTEKRPRDYVDPNIGTVHSRWFFYTPAAVPFGMAKPAPSTNGHAGTKTGWGAVGYDGRHTSIEGFPNFHEFQIGGLVYMPTVGNVITVPGGLENPDEGYRSRFDKQDEEAHPGYYSVVLKDYGIRAELTATPRVSLQRYTYPESSQSNIIIDIGHWQGESGPVKDASIAYADDGTIEGWIETEPVYVRTYQPGSTLRMYFSAVVDKRPASVGAFVDNRLTPGKRTSGGKGCGLYLTFATTKGEQVCLKTGLSYTSVANARLNRLTEAGKAGFDKVRKSAEKVWDDHLGRILVEGGGEAHKTKFYTGLYHALLGRGLASDVNGAYPKNDGGVGQIPLGKDGKPVHNHYNTDAVWGAFWNLTQLWSVAYPEYLSDWIQSQLLVYKDTGWLCDGIACSRFVSGVGTNFVSLVIAAAHNCGIRDFDVRLAYEAARKNELEWEGRPEGAGKMDVKAFLERGYSPTNRGFKPPTVPDGSRQGASHTLEYSFSSYAVARFAEQLGRTADYEELMKLSSGWKLLFDDSLKLIHPRGVDGKFSDPFDIYAPWLGFQEGNAVQYTYYVPHDAETLIARIGRETFSERLNLIFEESRKNIFGGGKTINAFSGLAGLYNHGNQPCLHIPWLFNFSGQPFRTQQWVRTICDEFYGTDELHGYGYGQDEDQGQLGVWFVMAGIGLFDVAGLTSPDPCFQIGSPMFDKVTIRLNRDYYPGREFVLETTNNGEENIYVQSIKVDGVPQESIRLPFQKVVNGGKVRLEMGANPQPGLTE